MSFMAIDTQPYITRPVTTEAPPIEPTFSLEMALSQVAGLDFAPAAQNGEVPLPQPPDEALSGWYSMLKEGARVPVFDYVTIIHAPINGTDAVTKSYVDGAITDSAAAIKVYVDNKTWGYSALPAEVQKLPIVFGFGGKPVVGTVINVPIVMPLTIPFNLVGSRFFATTAATNTTIFSLNKISGGVTTHIGIIVRKPDTISGSGGMLEIGDVLQLAAPAAQDPTLADVGVTIMAMRV